MSLLAAGVADAQAKERRRVQRQGGQSIAMVELHAGNDNEESGIGGAVPGLADTADGRGRAGHEEEGQAALVHGRPGAAAAAACSTTAAAANTGSSSGRRGFLACIVDGASRGVSVDIHACVDDDERVGAVHGNAEQFDASTEDTFKYLQVGHECVARGGCLRWVQGKRGVVVGGSCFNSYGRGCDSRAFRYLKRCSRCSLQWPTLSRMAPTTSQTPSGLLLRYGR